MRPPKRAILLSMFSLMICSAIAYGASSWVVPAGTRLNIRTTEPIAAANYPVGTKFTAVVDDPITVHGDIVIPRGAVATLEVVHRTLASNTRGRDRLTFRVLEIHTESGTYPVATNAVEMRGRSE